ncbi:MAG: PD40 domain-containing protein [Planctomycetes bacterium]|nr:PD40 domain-containing protein [Planctomycetota bacterium]
MAQLPLPRLDSRRPIRRTRVCAAVLGLAAALAAPLAATARGEETLRVTVDSAGVEANARSRGWRQCVAHENHETLVVFASDATNLDPADTNGKSDLFLRNVERGTTTRIVLDLRGGDPNGHSSEAVITPDGRFVAFSSDATDLVANDTNGVSDVFLLDRTTGAIERISVDSAGSPGNGFSVSECLSDDGDVVGFVSAADNLVPNDGNQTFDVFLRVRSKSQTICLSRTPNKVTGNGLSDFPTLSADGTLAAFYSDASDLVAGDLNGKFDLFVYDVKLATLRRASLNAGGFELDGDSTLPCMSHDGRTLAFQCDATNLHRDSTARIVQAFVLDLASGVSTLVSRGPDGAAANGRCTAVTLFTRTTAAGDRPQVAFWSKAINLVDSGGNDDDLFVVDLPSGVMQVASVDADGVDPQAVETALSVPGVTPDGHAIVFTSSVALEPADGNVVADLWLRQLEWTELAEYGSGLAGQGGYVPHLAGRGGSCEEPGWSVAIRDGRPLAVGLLWVAIADSPGLPLFGGTLFVDLGQPFLALPLALGGVPGVPGTGELLLGGADVGSIGTFDLFLQAAFVDAAAPKGIALSNALVLHVAPW